MGNRTHAASLLALGLAFGTTTTADAGPASPPPPATTRTNGPTPPTTGSPNPFLPTPRGSNATPTPPAPSARPPAPTTPPPPSVGPTGEGGASTTVEEPQGPPQDLSNTWGYSQRKTDRRPRYVRTNDPSYAAPNPVGFYSGVSVEGNHVPPLPAKEMGSTPAEMTWTGFERTASGGSRVFLQLNAEPAMEHKTSKDGLVLRVRLKNTKVNVRNNRRRLDLRYFKTPMREVKVRHRGRDTVVTIQLKQLATPSVQIVDGKAGYKLLMIEFGGAPPPAAPAS